MALPDLERRIFLIKSILLMTLYISLEFLKHHVLLKVP